MSPKLAKRGGKALRVGITGHRPNRMPERQWPRIRQELSDVMAVVESGYPERRLVLLSGLAEGADRLAAFVALGRGWSLRAVLAFHRTRFEEDFPAPFAVGEFRALLAAADKIDEPRKNAHLGLPPEEGYHAVGQQILARSEVLIAVWDGEGSQGKGGTVDVIEAARANRIPVIWIHASKAQKPKWLDPAGMEEGKAAPRKKRTSAD
jgi:hypothetical protein